MKCLQILILLVSLPAFSSVTVCTGVCSIPSVGLKTVISIANDKETSLRKLDEKCFQIHEKATIGNLFKLEITDTDYTYERFPAAINSYALSLYTLGDSTCDSL
jgi:hypothetical protein